MKYYEKDFGHPWGVRHGNFIEIPWACSECIRNNGDPLPGHFMCSPVDPRTPVSDATLTDTGWKALLFRFSNRD